MLEIIMLSANKLEWGQYELQLAVKLQSAEIDDKQCYLPKSAPLHAPFKSVVQKWQQI